MSQRFDAIGSAADCKEDFKDRTLPHDTCTHQYTRSIDTMTKSSILVKICLFFVSLHGLQISVAIGRSNMKTHYYNQRLESILNSWDMADKAERIHLLTDYYSAQTELEAFQSPHARDFVYQYILHQEDDGIDRWIVDEAFDIANQRNKERKSGLAYGGRWEVPFGFHYRHRFNLTSLEKFGVEELRDLILKIRDGESEVERHLSENPETR